MKIMVALFGRQWFESSWFLKKELVIANTDKWVFHF